jgi:hypothetical protein
LGGFAFIEIFENSVSVPAATGFVGAAPFVGVATIGEQNVGSFETVTAFACAHGVVIGSIENCWQSVMNDIGWHFAGVVCVGIVGATWSIGRMPKGAARHDYVA